jgi:hypothetical protein
MRSDGRLQVTASRVHKEPNQEDGRWIQTSRYGFENDEVKEVP